jgi:hypothetical protein
MDNVTFFTIEPDNTQWVLIDRGNGEFTSMTKAYYDEQQANQNNPVGGN